MSKEGNDKHKLILLSEAAKDSPYSQEYLSLLARKGKIFAKKIGRNWFTTKEAIREYLRKQSLAILIPKNKLQHQERKQTPILISAPIEPDQLDKEKVKSTLEEEFEKLNVEAGVLKGETKKVSEEESEEEKVSEKEEQKEEEVKITKPSPVRITNSVIPVEIKNEKINVEDVEAHQKLEDISKEIGKLKIQHTEELTKKLDKIEKIQREPSNLTEEEKDFVSYGSQSRWFKFRKFDGSSKRLLNNPQKAMAVMIGVVVVLFLLAGGFSFGRIDKVAYYFKKALKDADTLQGHFPGTHANEVLVLDKAGNISIYGHIETQGQLRSYAPQGVAPLVVDSITKVENLNADYLDDLDSKDFTLAFVTKNGNVTYEDVFLEGKVEIGKSLLVKGAVRLLDSLMVDGELGVLGDAVFGRDVKLTGGDLTIEKGNLVLNTGTIEINNRKKIENLNADLLDGLDAQDFTLDRVVSNGDTAYSMAFFDAGIWARYGAFGSLGVSGDVSIGNEDEPSDSTFAVYSKKFRIDNSGNLTASGTATLGNLIVSGTVQSDLVPSGSFSLGSSSNRWNYLYANTLDAATANISNLVVSGSMNFAGTSSSSFRVNTDNVSSDSEDSYLAFDRGAINPSAIILWDSTNNQFNFNQPVKAASTSLEVAGFASVSGNIYAFGNVGIGTSNPVVKLQVVGSASVSQNLEVAGYVSASQTFGSGLVDCSGSTDKLIWDSSTGKFTCVPEATGIAGTLAIRESDTTFSNRSSLSFESAHFNVSQTQHFLTDHPSHLNQPTLMYPIQTQMKP